MRHAFVYLLLSIFIISCSDFESKNKEFKYYYELAVTQKSILFLILHVGHKLAASQVAVFFAFTDQLCLKEIWLKK